jgi:hypothetical protein
MVVAAYQPLCRAVLRETSMTYGHEVDDQIEDDSIGDLVRQIGDHTGETFGGSVVKGITFVLFDDRTLSVEGQDLAEEHQVRSAVDLHAS